MQAAILAGGRATRLGPLTDKVPKALVEISGKPFLEYQLGFLKKSGVTDIVLCLGHLGEQVERYFGDGGEFGVNLTYSYEKEQLLGTAGALRNAGHLLRDRFFVVYGDGYLFLDFKATLSCFIAANKLGLMTVYNNYEQYDKSNVIVDGNLVKHYSKEDLPEGLIYIDYGASILKKEVLEMVPLDQVYSLERLFNKLIEIQELMAYEVNTCPYEIGSPEGLEEFKRYMSREGNL